MNRMNPRGRERERWGKNRIRETKVVDFPCNSRLSSFIMY